MGRATNNKSTFGGLSISSPGICVNDSEPDVFYKEYCVGKTINIIYDCDINLQVPMYYDTTDILRLLMKLFKANMVIRC